MGPSAGPSGPAIRATGRSGAASSGGATIGAWPFVLVVVGMKCGISASRSIGSGKMIVEFFSAAISVSVCR